MDVTATLAPWRPWRARRTPFRAALSEEPVEDLPGKRLVTELLPPPGRASSPRPPPAPPLPRAPAGSIPPPPSSASSPPLRREGGVVQDPVGLAEGLGLVDVVCALQLELDARLRRTSAVGEGAMADVVAGDLDAKLVVPVAEQTVLAAPPSRCRRAAGSGSSGAPTSRVQAAPTAQHSRSGRCPAALAAVGDGHEHCDEYEVERRARVGQGTRACRLNRIRPMAIHRLDSVHRLNLIIPMPGYLNDWVRVENQIVWTGWHPADLVRRGPGPTSRACLHVLRLPSSTRTSTKSKSSTRTSTKSKSSTSTSTRSPRPPQLPPTEAFP